MAVVTMKQLLDSGTHFGHQTRRWNPKMKRFIFTDRNGIYIIDLQQTLTYIDKAYEFVKETVAHGGTIMFVGTKKQAQESIAAEATRVGMPYVNQRWLGGMLTNFSTVHKRLQRLKELEAMEQTGGFEGRTKKEILMLTREKNKLERSLGGIRDMAKVPSAIWVVDTNKEHLAVARGSQAEHPGHRDPGHQLRSRPGRLPDPGQRRRDPLGRAADQGGRLRGRRGPAGPCRRGGNGDKPEAEAAEPLAEWEQELLASATATASPTAEGAAAGHARGRRSDRTDPPTHHRKGYDMANYTAADVKRLRELTGAGMLDCKNALAETDGDFDKAVELLRIKGAKDVGKRAERATAEGLVAAKDGALIELNSETDFVAKNAEFQALADEIVAAAAAAKAADVDALKAAKVGDTHRRAGRSRTCRRRSARSSNCAASPYFDGTVETYLHKRAADLPPAVGVLVEYTGSATRLPRPRTRSRCRSPR